MRMMVAGGRLGAAQAAERQDVAIIVDALRASATTATMLHYGAREIVVVEDLEGAFAEARQRPGCLLAGERGGLMVEGFDLGNSPLQKPLPTMPQTIVFSSSNMSRCCVGASSCPVVLLGTLLTCTACAQRALAAARDLSCGITLVTAGSVLDETKVVLEDYIAAGALMAKLVALSEDEAVASGDAALAAVAIHEAAVAEGLERSFLQTDNGISLCGLGFEGDVRFASRVDVVGTVPQVKTTYVTDRGETAAVLNRS